MKADGIIKHYFPGGNTTHGFHSFFQHIIELEEANHLYSLKGGPGTGKSSLMKKIGHYFSEHGYDVEFHHCSSDPDSLDAVVIPYFKVALLDGTAPHVVDPRFPGAVDEIINLGDHWDSNQLKRYKNEILEMTKENSRLFKKAYGYLKAAGSFHDVYEQSAYKAFDPSKLNKIIEDLKSQIFTHINIENKLGKQRDLFAFGITPKGIINYRDQLLNAIKKRYVIKEDYFSTSETLLNRIKEEAVIRGLNVTCLYSPIKTTKILDLIIDDLDIIISVNNNYHEYNFEYDYCLDLTHFVDENQKYNIQDEVFDDIKNFENTLEKAISFIKKAKENHDELEKFYVETMDFSMHESLLLDLIEQIKKMES
jgi:hypothetical protein